MGEPRTPRPRIPPSAQPVCRSAIALGGLLNDVVFIGEPMAPFFTTHCGLRRLRLTDDGDVVRACHTRKAYAGPCAARAQPTAAQPPRIAAQAGRHDPPRDRSGLLSGRARGRDHRRCVIRYSHRRSARSLRAEWGKGKYPAAGWRWPAHTSQWKRRHWEIGAPAGAIAGFRLHRRGTTVVDEAVAKTPLTAGGARHVTLARPRPSSSGDGHAPQCDAPQRAGGDGRALPPDLLSGMP